MALEHLTNDVLMKKYFGPQSEVGDKSIYLAETPRITIQKRNPSIGKVSLHIRFFGHHVNSLEKTNPYYYTSQELKKWETKGTIPKKPDRTTFANFDQFFSKVFTLNSHLEFNNVIFNGGEPLLWQLDIAKCIRLSCEQFDNRKLTFDIETDGGIIIEPEISDWFKRANIYIRAKNNMCPLLSQLTNHRSSRCNGWIHFEHNHWYVIFNYDTVSMDNINKCIKTYNLSKDKILLESRKNMIECMKLCIKNGYNYSVDLEGVA